MLNIIAIQKQSCFVCRPKYFFMTPPRLGSKQNITAKWGLCFGLLSLYCDIWLMLTAAQWNKLMHKMWFVMAAENLNRMHRTQILRIKRIAYSRPCRSSRLLHQVLHIVPATLAAGTFPATTQTHFCSADSTSPFPIYKVSDKSSFRTEYLAPGISSPLACEIKE